MIRIRAATADDAAAIAAIYAPHVTHAVTSFEDAPPDAATMAARIESSDGLYPWIVAISGEDEGGDVLGYAYATRFRDRPAYRWVAETSIYLAPDAQRRGTGRLLYEALVETLRAQGFIQAIGVIALPNDASIAVHEAVGFRRAGVFRQVGFKLGQWVDIGIWQRELHTPVADPVEPRRFSEVGVVRR